jgi:PleD family two-component response regulator
VAAWTACANGWPRCGDSGVSVTLSAGLAEHHAGENVMHSLERAQAALLEAKSAGRNRVQVAP